ncbi:calpain 7, partial [Coemansia aciculifera]
MAIEAKFGEYASRASALISQQSTKPEYGADLDSAHAALAEARLAHLRGDTGAALDLYVKGIDAYQRILLLEKAAGATSWTREVRKFAAVCLVEAERTKAKSSMPLESIVHVPLVGSEPATFQQQQDGSQSPSIGSTGSAEERLTSTEANVVKHTSHINGLTFLPWLDNDLEETFNLPDYFTDKDGLPALSAKQQRRLWKWRRASQMYSNAQIFGTAGCGHIVQETVTDCS